MSKDLQIKSQEYRLKPEEIETALYFADTLPRDVNNMLRSLVMADPNLLAEIMAEQALPKPVTHQEVNNVPVAGLAINAKQLDDEKQLTAQQQAVDEARRQVEEARNVAAE